MRPCRDVPALLPGGDGHAAAALDLPCDGGNPRAQRNAAMRWSRPRGASPRQGAFPRERRRAERLRDRPGADASARSRSPVARLDRAADAARSCRARDVRGGTTRRRTAFRCRDSGASSGRRRAAIPPPACAGHLPGRSVPATYAEALRLPAPRSAATGKQSGRASGIPPISSRRPTAASGLSGCCPKSPIGATSVTCLHETQCCNAA